MDFFAFKFIFRCIIAVIAGGLIGAERARHGRAAGMRTHILVSLGSALTAMTGIYVNNVMDISGDPFRISAQVISGVGFLGAGMIVLKNGSNITGLTTAAGVWTTATIGIAIGYGFYLGAATVTALLLLAIVFLTRFEKYKKDHQYIYAEIRDISCLNQVVEKIESEFSENIIYKITPPRSGSEGCVGIEIDFRNNAENTISRLIGLDNVVFAIKDNE
ncbi:MAG: MgtC/SapB family protein [Clostridia bacterium]|nr:MgtC/SapB family protein [Clostridia bacterium]